MTSEPKLSPGYLKAVLEQVVDADAKLFVCQQPDFMTHGRDIAFMAERGWPLPFATCALLEANHGILLVAKLEDGELRYEAFVCTAAHYAHAYSATVGNDLLIRHSSPRQDVAECIQEDTRFLCTFFRMVAESGGTAYTATPNPANKKRIANGKKPLFAWTTINIDAPRYKSVPQGGTHASPRLHDRRGHWVTNKNGKRFWRKATKVGKAKDGIAVLQTYVKRNNTHSPDSGGA